MFLVRFACCFLILLVRFLKHVNFLQYFFLIWVCFFSVFKVTVRCACQILKKEWICQDVQAAYCNSGRDPKDISKNQFGVGLLSCSSECTRKLKVVDSELQLRKPKVLEVSLHSKNMRSIKVLLFCHVLQGLVLFEMVISYQHKCFTRSALIWGGWLLWAWFHNLSPGFKWCKMGGFKHMFNSWKPNLIRWYTSEVPKDTKKRSNNI